MLPNRLRFQDDYGLSRALITDHRAGNRRQADTIPVPESQLLKEAMDKQAGEQQRSMEDLRLSQEELEKFERDIDRMHSLMETVRPLLKIDEMASILEKMSEEHDQWNFSDTITKNARRQLKTQAEQWEWMENTLQELSESSSDSSHDALQLLRQRIQRRSMAERARKLSERPSSASRELQDYRHATKRLRYKCVLTFSDNLPVCSVRPNPCANASLIIGPAG